MFQKIVWIFFTKKVLGVWDVGISDVGSFGCSNFFGNFGCRDFGCWEFGLGSVGKVQEENSLLRTEEWFFVGSEFEKFCVQPKLQWVLR